MKRSFFILALVFVAALSPATAAAQTESVHEAEVTGHTQEEYADHIEHTLTLRLTTGEEATVTYQSVQDIPAITYDIGDRVLVHASSTPQGEVYYSVVDHVRRPALGSALLLFAIIALAVGRMQGVRSFVGLAVSFLIIVKGILPLLLAGYSPVLVAVGGSLCIAAVTFYLSHGVSQKTTTALAGTVISLSITGLLAHIFVSWAALSGTSGDEVTFLVFGQDTSLHLQGLLLAGIIIGALGVLDDITISQAAVVQQLKAANPDLTPSALMTHAMQVGRDHIASLINTLVLVYTGAALPLLLLFISQETPFLTLINYEVVAEEIIRMLMGSSGLILAVPITTYLAVKVLPGDAHAGHSHGH